MKLRRNRSSDSVEHAAAPAPLPVASQLELGAACQPWIAKDELSGLPTHIAMTPSVTLFVLKS